MCFLLSDSVLWLICLSTFSGELQLGNGAITTHTYAAAGAYTAIVTATNGTSLVTATTQVLIVTSRIYLPLVMRN